MSVVDRRARCIDLSNQGAALDADVLDKLRGALRLNDYFVHLDLSDNLLSDDSVAMLCAILKDKTYLETLGLRACGIEDGDFSLYLTPAILARNRIRRLDLGRNSGLTDACVESLCRLLDAGTLEELRLSGTAISKAGGEQLMEALERNAALELCELPYTVGFKVLKRCTFLTRRNERHKRATEDAAQERQRMENMLIAVDEGARALGAASPKQTRPGPRTQRVPGRGDGSDDDDRTPRRAGPPRDGEGAGDGDLAAQMGMGRTQQEEIAVARYRTRAGRKLALCGGAEAALQSFAVPPSTAASTRSYSQSGALSRVSGPGSAMGGAGLALPLLSNASAARGLGDTQTSLSAAYAGYTSFGTLRDGTFRSATDPAVNRSLHHLRVLDARCSAVEAHRAAARSGRARKCGLSRTRSGPAASDTAAASRATARRQPAAAAAARCLGCSTSEGAGARGT